MIKLKTMKWGHAFSYGADNTINFEDVRLLQLVGQNGHGKTSLALVLEEVLYNKNSKGIKKADVLNRYSKEKAYTISLEFEKDGVEYYVETKRGSTQSVKLMMNGADISAHTSTATYKMIEDIIGMDHRAFSQIVFQSTSSSLEFLTATDSNRKKFLIELLNLGKYTEAGEVFKAVAKGLETEILVRTTKVGSATTWLDKNSKIDLKPRELVPVPASPRAEIEQITALKDTLKNILLENKKIIQNNKYKEILDSITLNLHVTQPAGDANSLLPYISDSKKVIADAIAFNAKMGKLGNKCPTCLQDIDSHKIAELVAEQNQCKLNAEAQMAELHESLDILQRAEAEWKKQVEAKTQYEQYYSLYDPELSTIVLDKEVLDRQVRNLEAEVTEIELRIASSTGTNNSVTTHNAKIEVIRVQNAELKAQIQDLNNELALLNSRLNHVLILVKTFSPTGLVAYKIECLVKDLEELTNAYLTELSGGRFQLGFQISTSDKLNVVITDNGRDIDILALSGGERARVNVATLLGIRKLLQSLSNNRINLLILDETIENLDLDGKEKLVEVLLNEEHLNTIVVSHAFSHPLLEKLHVVKTNNISRIE